MKTMTVLGAGTWGTALAIHLGRLGHRVRLWGRDQHLVADMIAGRRNPTYLPDVPFPESVSLTGSLETALDRSDYVIAAVPSHGLRDVIRALPPLVPVEATIVSAVKGLEVGTLLRMSQVIEQELGRSRPITVLSGPSFAMELARQRLTAVLVAGDDAGAVGAVQQDFRAQYFRLYASDDVTGVEIGGALKNIIAIAVGVVEALDLGHNALAAVTTRGLAEISRLACAVGGRRNTLAGLSGLGDLILTCTGRLSRNHQVGLELGKGRPLPEILSGMKMVAEGVKTTGAALELGARHGVELPIAAQMADVLAGRKDPRAAVEELMLRRQRPETDLG